jgi:hypothetical protein
MGNKDIRIDKYNVHKNGAKSRNIEWLFTFDTWWDMWEQSGKWSQRGNKRGCYVMARIGDIGPYCPTNVRIILAEDNHKEAKINGRLPSIKGRVMSKETRAKISIANKGKIISEEWRTKNKERVRNEPKVHCPHCNVNMDRRNAAKYHFDRCKSLHGHM